MFKRIAFVFLSVATLYGDPDPETVKLTILTFNDIYDVNAQNGYLGVAGLKTLLDKERQTSDRYITTVNGDFLSPSIYSSVSKGKHMIDIFNLLEVDVVTFGNHEFDFGAEVLADRIKESEFVWLGTNVIDIHSGMPFANTASTVLFQIGTITFGMIGLTTTETAELSSAPRGILFAPIILSAQAAVHKLKKHGADVVIALTHLYFNEDIQLARNVPEIDVILGGHDHEPMAYIEGNTLIFKSGVDGKYLGRIDLEIEKRQVGERSKTIVYPSYKLLPNHGYERNPQILAKLEEFKTFAEMRMSAKLGITTDAMTTKTVRKGENAFANIVTDALRKYYNADIGILNGGAIRGFRDYSAAYGLTRGDIQAELPFNNVAVLIEISGENLLKAIEYGLMKMDEQCGCFLHFSGLRVVYDSKSKPGSRVREVFVNDQPIDRNAKFKVATADYVIRGGDGNSSFTNSNILVGSGTGKLLADVLSDYIKQLEIIHPALEGRIIEINENIGIEVINSSDDKRIKLRQNK